MIAEKALGLMLLAFLLGHVIGYYGGRHAEREQRLDRRKRARDAVSRDELRRPW